MTAVGDLARLANTGQALALVGHNMGIVKKKKIKSKDLIKMGVTNIAGVSLIRATGQSISGL